ncbi:NUDIX domain-containing protein [Candidatus Kaiserbacteria bacterium]|nr:NUDIX domain-containing protein [Candidatus Kaiserbacteria bacterium]
MEIQSTLTNRAGQVLKVIYRDIENEEDIESHRRVSGVHAYCFHKDKMVVVYAPSKHYWTLPGGGVEEGELLRDAVEREVKEETNMRVLQQRFIGFQDIFEPGRVVSQTRSVCLVEPYGPFLQDPDGDITEVKLIDPQDYRRYFDWGEIGDHLMRRALQIGAKMGHG